MKCNSCSLEFETEESLIEHNLTHNKKGFNKAKIFWLVFTIIMLVLIIYLALQPKPTYTPLPRIEQFEGNPNATVTITEFSDFECPACRYFSYAIEPQLKQAYIDSGKVKFEYKHFPLSIHPYAEKAAEAVECAADQGKFWQFHDKLFEVSSKLDIKSLKKYAKDMNLDTTSFNACLDSDAMALRIKEDTGLGLKMNVQATPSFFINNQVIVGAKPFEQFKSVIDSELANFSKV